MANFLFSCPTARSPVLCVPACIIDEQEKQLESMSVGQDVKHQIRQMWHLPRTEASESRYVIPRLNPFSFVLNRPFDGCAVPSALRHGNSAMRNDRMPITMLGQYIAIDPTENTPKRNVVYLIYKPPQSSIKRCATEIRCDEMPVSTINERNININNKMYGEANTAGPWIIVFLLILTEEIGGKAHDIAETWHKTSRNIKGRMWRGLQLAQTHKITFMVMRRYIPYLDADDQLDVYKNSRCVIYDNHCDLETKIFDNIYFPESVTKALDHVSLDTVFSEFGATQHAV